MVRAVVYKEHTLGLLKGDKLEVLNDLNDPEIALNSQKPVCVFEEEVRNATISDFKRFNVKYFPTYEVA